MARWPLLTVCQLLGCILAVNSLPQSPFEGMAFGAAVLAGSAADALQSGGAVRREHDVETPFFSVHSKSEAGMGDAMRPRAADSSEEDDRRRRKRSLGESPLIQQLLTPVHSHLLRNKRSPCHSRPSGGTGGTTGGGAETIDPEEVRRRSARMRTAKASKNTKQSKGRTAKKTAKQGKKGRSRRQADLDNLEENMRTGDTNFSSDNFNQLAEKMRNIFQSIANTMFSLMDRLRETFSGGDNETESVYN